MFQVVAGILCAVAALPCAGLGFVAARFAFDSAGDSDSTALPGIGVLLTIFAGAVTAVSVLATVALTALAWMLLRG